VPLHPQLRTATALVINKESGITALVTTPNNYAINASFYGASTGDCLATSSFSNLQTSTTSYAQNDFGNDSGQFDLSQGFDHFQATLVPSQLAESPWTQVVTSYRNILDGAVPLQPPESHMNASPLSYQSRLNLVPQIDLNGIFGDVDLSLSTQRQLSATNESLGDQRTLGGFDISNGSGYSISSSMAPQASSNNRLNCPNCMITFGRDADRIRHNSAVHGINRGTHLCPIRDVRRVKAGGIADLTRSRSICGGSTVIWAMLRVARF